VTEKEKGARPWRVGNSVGRTLYDANDTLIGTMDTPELATMVEGAVNVVAMLEPGDIPWLVKDFDILYRSAAALIAQLDAGCHDDPDPVAIEALRAQLGRLRPAFEHIRSLKQTLVDNHERAVFEARSKRP